MIKDLKKYLTKNWGKKCKDYSALCATCQVWRAFEEIESLDEIKGHLTNWKKILK